MSDEILRDDAMVPATKCCTRCRQERPAAAFYRQRRVTNREWYTLSSWCRACSRAVTAARRAALGGAAETASMPPPDVRPESAGTCGVCRETGPVVPDWDAGRTRGLVCRECLGVILAARHQVTRLERVVQYLERTDE